MYQPHPVFETPADEVKLWRYMDVGRFLALLSNNALYFSRKHELDDPLEGVVSPLSVQRATGELSTSEQYNRSAAETLCETNDLVASSAVISCWHANNWESVAMWCLYTSGDEGIAIQTTVGRLKRAFERESCAITIAKVIDRDRDSEYVGDTWALDSLAPLFCKGRGYVHEQEVRCVIKYPEGQRAQAAAMLAMRSADNVGPERVPDDDLGDHGLALQVNFATLIERIVASRRYPAWAIPALQDIVDRAGLTILVETSSLLEPPPNLTTARPQAAQ